MPRKHFILSVLKTVVLLNIFFGNNEPVSSKEHYKCFLAESIINSNAYCIVWYRPEKNKYLNSNLL